ncbi:MAG: SdrD B-like domain-containing protein [Chloroflexota bacterium]
MTIQKTKRLSDSLRVLLSTLAVMIITLFTVAEAEAAPPPANLLTDYDDPVCQSAEFFLDEFETASYSNNDGTRQWNGDWVEYDVRGSGPSSGVIQVSGGLLKLSDNPGTGTQPYVFRGADLTGATNAQFSFDYFTSGNLESTDRVTIWVYSPSLGWDPLQTFSNDTSGTRTFDISSYISSNTRVAFQVTQNYGGFNELFNVREVKVCANFPVTQGSIGDQIWSDPDNDGNGALDGDDFPLQGVTVDLMDSSGTIIATDVTDANGNYLFGSLDLDTYTVAIDVSTLPSNKQGNPAYDPDGGSDNQATVTLTESSPNNLDQDFAYFQIQGSIGDQIWSDPDNDGNGTLDGDDFPIEGAIVNLKDAGGAIVATDTTDANGLYLFEGLALGTYSVEVDINSLPGIKQGNPAYDPDGGGDNRSTVTITAAQPENRAQDFAYFETTGSIGDQIWSDPDNDGNNVIDGDDFPVPGVVVNLEDDGGTVIASETTDSNGLYLFDGLALGSYTVVIDTSTLPDVKQGNPAYDPDGGDDNRSSVVLTLAQPNDTEQDFAYFHTKGNIGDQIWSDPDSDGNGLLDGDDFPIQGVVVQLIDSNNVQVATDTTDSSGFYFFSGLELGTYTVAIDVSTLPQQSSQVYDPDGVNDNQSTVTLTAATPNNLEQDFAYAESAPVLGSVGDTINCVTTGSGLAGVTVILTGLASGPVIDITEADGTYLFSDLPFGSYTISVDPSTITGTCNIPAVDPDGVLDNSSSVLLTALVPNDLEQDFGYRESTTTTCGTLMAEAEDGTLSPRWMVVQDANASNGAYIVVQDQTGNESALSDTVATYCLTVEEAGTYFIEGTFNAPFASANSVFVTVDGEPAVGYLWDTQVTTGFTTGLVGDRGVSGPVSVSLDAGEHDVAFYLREDGWQLDKVRLVLDQPSGMLGSIGDTITCLDSGAGLAGVTVTLTGLASGPVNATTAADGTYLFGSLPLGTYTVSVDPSTITGTCNVPASDPDGVLDNASSVTLTAGMPDVLDQDFGYTEQTSTTCGTLMAEAEDGTLSPRWVVVNDANASNGAYIVVQDQTGNETALSDTVARYCLTVEQAGTYFIEGTVNAPFASANSVFVTVDGLPVDGYLWDTSITTGFVAELVQNRGVAGPVSVALDAGEHEVAVYLREDGFQLDKVRLVLDQPGGGGPVCAGLDQEAENGSLNGLFTVVNDANASNGAYVEVPNGAGNENFGPSGSFVEHCFIVDTAGTYNIEGTINGPVGGSNSFYVTVDDTPTDGYLWDTTLTTGFEADLVANRGGDDPVAVNLDAGEHRVKVFLREDGTQLDKLRLVLVTPDDPLACGDLRQEGEDGNLFGNFAVANDSAASGGRFVQVLNGTGNQTTGPNDAQKVEYCVDVEITDTYIISAVVRTPNIGANSMYVTVDGLPVNGITWDMPISTEFFSTQVIERGTTTPYLFNLAAGEHTVTFYLREDGTQLDLFELVPTVAAAAVNTDLSSDQAIGDGIYGYVYIAGASTSTEPMLAGHKVTLVDAETGETVAETETNHIAKFYFDGLAIGDYIVQLDGMDLEQRVTTNDMGMVEASFHEVDEQNVGETDMSEGIFLPMFVK